MNLVELGLVADICCRWTRISVMEVDMWYMAAVMTMVVYGSGDDDGGYMAAVTMMMRQRRRDNL